MFRSNLNHQQVFVVVVSKASEKVCLMMEYDEDKYYHITKNV